MYVERDLSDHKPGNSQYTRGKENDLVLKIDVYDKDQPYTENDFVDFLRATVPLESNSGRIQQFLATGSRNEDQARFI